MTDVQKTLAEFKRLFWHGRKLSIRKSTKAEGRSRFEEAARLAEEAGMNAEAEIARACIFEVESKLEEAITALEKALEDPDVRLPALAWHVMGSVNKEINQFDKAIECYQKALDTPKYDSLGYSKNAMGNAYFDKNEYDKAIDCYQSSLEIPDYDTPGDALLNMGNAYREKKEYNKAIECYQKALAIPDYDTPGYALNNLGVAYHMKTEYDKAIEYYQKALANPDYDIPGLTLNNMGIAYEEMKDYDNAIDCYWKAAEHYRKSGEKSSADIAESKARALEMPKDRRSAVEEALIEKIDPTEGVTTKDAGPVELSIEDRILTKNEQAGSDCYSKYHQNQPESGLDYVIATLRGWSSATPLVGKSVREQVRGGGYFLRWGGKGLVIDPGFDFIRNFHEKGFNVREIDAIIVTHDHSDHNDDLIALDDLRFELGRRINYEGAREDWKHHVLLDEDTFNIFKDRLASEGDYKAYHPQQQFIPDRLDLHPHTTFEDFRELEVKPLPFCIKYFKTKHGGESLKSVGLRIECFEPESDLLALVIGYTSDTEFFPELCDERHLGGSDILIVHISEPHAKEFKNPDHIKENHLGFRGVEKLIKGCQPRLTILGEFWAGFADLRIDLTHALQHLCDTKNIIPSGIGLMIDPRDLNDLKIRCTNCKSWCSIKDILVTSPAHEFGELGYLCRNCCVCR